MSRPVCTRAKAGDVILFRRFLNMENDRDRRGRYSRNVYALVTHSVGHYCSLIMLDDGSAANANEDDQGTIPRPASWPQEVCAKVALYQLTGQLDGLTEGED